MSENTYVGHDSGGYQLFTDDVMMRDLMGHDLAIGDLVIYAHPTGPGGITQYLGQIVGGGTDAPIEIRDVHVSALGNTLRKRTSQLAFYSDQYRDAHPALLAEMFGQGSDGV